MYLSLPLRRLVSPLLQQAYPESLPCSSCGVPVRLTAFHDLKYTETSGCSAICEDCHEDLPRERRLWCYLDLVRRWERDGMDPDEAMSRWLSIMDAVLLEGTAGSE